MGYSKDEIDAFNKKDKRISRLSILRDVLPKFDLEGIENVQEITELAEKYVNYVYNGVIGGGAIAMPEQTDWDKLSENLNLRLPKGIEVKMLNLIVDEYKNSTGENVNPINVIQLVMDRFGTYPTKQASVEKVINILLKG